MKQMRNLAIIISLLAAGLVASAQGPTSGKITYEEKVKIEIKLEGEAAAMYADMIPPERTTKKLLQYSPEASIFTEAPADVEEEMNSSFHFESGMTVKIGSSENKVFTDLKNKKLIEQRDFMTRMFLIESDIPNTKWKITGNQKMILEMPCMEATSTNEDGKVTTVWFTPAIPVQAGPAKFCNLPGMVLEVNVDNGNQTLTAIAIEETTPDPKELQKPKEGKKVTGEEFKQIVAEKMKEMGVEGEPGSGETRTMQITIKH